MTLTAKECVLITSLAIWPTLMALYGARRRRPLVTAVLLDYAPAAATKDYQAVTRARMEVEALTQDGVIEDGWGKILVDHVAFLIFIDGHRGCIPNEAAMRIWEYLPVSIDDGNDAALALHEFCTDFDLMPERTDVCPPWIKVNKPHPLYSFILREGREVRRRLQRELLDEVRASAALEIAIDKMRKKRHSLQALQFFLEKKRDCLGFYTPPFNY